MFVKLSRKIKYIIFFVVAIVLFACYFIAYHISKTILLNNYINQIVYSVDQSYNGFQMYMNLTEETARLITDDGRIKNVLQNPKYSLTVTSQLDSVINSNLSINDLTLYSLDGFVYHSSSGLRSHLKNYIAFDEFNNEFAESKENLLWKVRPYYIGDTVSNNNYLLSLFVKVKSNDNKTIGYLVADTEIKNIYNYFDASNNDIYNDINLSFLSNSSILFSSSDKNLEIAEDIIANRYQDSEYVHLKKKKVVLIYRELAGSEMVISVPLKSLITKLNLFNSLLSAITVFFSALFILLVNLLAKTISVPLNELYSKMKSFP